MEVNDFFDDLSRQLVYRDVARETKNFAIADKVRKNFDLLGIEIEDSGGQKCKLKGEPRYLPLWLGYLNHLISLKRGKTYKRHTFFRWFYYRLKYRLWLFRYRYIPKKLRQIGFFINYTIPSLLRRMFWINWHNVIFQCCKPTLKVLWGNIKWFNLEGILNWISHRTPLTRYMCKKYGYKA